MPTHRIHKKPAAIAIYDTTQGGEFHIRKGLERTTGNHPLRIVYVTGQDIQDGCLNDRSIIGLALPGRTRGTDYLNELQDAGLRSIQQATRKGLNLMTICAGSYILSRTTRWHDQHTDTHHTVEAAYPVFDGVCDGPINALYQDAYIQKIAPSDSSLTYKHPANIVTVSSCDPHPFAIEYNGGGRFIAHEPHTVTTLLHHHTPDALPAAIEFAHGQGIVQMYNVHPEVLPRVFKAVFAPSLKGTPSLARLEHDVAALQDSQAARDALFNRFVENCLNGPKYQRFANNQHRMHSLFTAPDSP